MQLTTIRKRAPNVWQKYKKLITYPELMSDIDADNMPLATQELLEDQYSYIVNTLLIHDYIKLIENSRSSSNDEPLQPITVFRIWGDFMNMQGLNKLFNYDSVQSELLNVEAIKRSNLFIDLIISVIVEEFNKFIPFSTVKLFREGGDEIGGLIIVNGKRKPAQINLISQIIKATVQSINSSIEKLMIEMGVAFIEYVKDPTNPSRVGCGFVMGARKVKDPQNSATQIILEKQVTKEKERLGLERRKLIKHKGVSKIDPKLGQEVYKKLQAFLSDFSFTPKKIPTQETSLLIDQLNNYWHSNKQFPPFIYCNEIIKSNFAPYVLKKIKENSRNLHFLIVRFSNLRGMNEEYGHLAADYYVLKLTEAINNGLSEAFALKESSSTNLITEMEPEVNPSKITVSQLCLLEMRVNNTIGILLDMSKEQCSSLATRIKDVANQMCKIVGLTQIPNYNEKQPNGLPIIVRLKELNELKLSESCEIQQLLNEIYIELNSSDVDTESQFDKKNTFCPMQIKFPLHHPDGCDVYLMSMAPAKDDFWYYKNSYIFMKKKLPELFYIDNKANCEELKFDTPALNKIKGLKNIDESRPLKGQISDKNLTKFWRIITSNKGKVHKNTENITTPNQTIQIENKNPSYEPNEPIWFHRSIIDFNPALKEYLRVTSPYFLGNSLAAASNYFSNAIFFRSSAATSESALTATNLMYAEQALLVNPTLAVAAGTGVLIGEADAGRNYSSAVGNIFRHSLLINMVAGVPCIVIMLMSRPILLAINEPTDAVALVEQYFQGYVFSIPFQMAMRVQQQALLGADSAGIGLIQQFSQSAFNAGFNYILISGILKFLPIWGIRSLGYSMAAATGINSLAMTLFLSFSARYSPYHLFQFLLNNSTSILRRLMQIGLPYAGQMFIEQIGVLGAAIMAGWLGEQPTSALQISSRYVFPATVLGFACAQSLATLIGRSNGEGNYIKAKNLSIAAVMTANLLLLPLEVLFCTVPRLLAEPLIDVNDSANAEILALLPTIMKIQALVLALDTTRNILEGGLRGTGTSMFSFLCNIFCMIVFLGLGYEFAFEMDMGINGLYIARAIGLSIINTMLFYKLRSRLNYAINEGEYPAAAETNKSLRHSLDIDDYIQSKIASLLPADFKIGKKFPSDEDSLFDAIAQALNSLPNQKCHTISSLRKICYKFSIQQENFWLEEKLKSKGINYHEYKLKISFSSEEYDAFNLGSNDKAIKGHVEIEGCIICAKLGISLRVITINEGQVSYKDINVDNSVPHGILSTNRTTKNVLYIIESEDNFFPVITSNPTSWLRSEGDFSYKDSASSITFFSKQSSASSKNAVDTHRLVLNESDDDYAYTNSFSKTENFSASKEEDNTQLLDNENFYEA